MRTAAPLLILVFAVVAALAYAFMPRLDLGVFGYGGQANLPERPSVLFVGDVMLGRDIERRTEQYGAQYPYERAAELLRSAHAAVGNFEAAVPREHEPTPDGSLTFSVREESLGHARLAGFDIFSLANNHAYDFAAEGYTHTRHACTRAGLVCAGDPNGLSMSSVETVALPEATVGIIFVNAVTGEPSHSTLTTVIDDAAARSDVLIAYIHWGTEYEPVHDARQEALAHALVDRGIDVVIGHHPHVVQDIELYRGAPIFYSLGNFIFDQYFSSEVQEGLVVALAVTAADLEFTLFPVSSLNAKGQPRPLSGLERDAFVSALNGRSPTIELTSHTFTLPR